MPSIIFFFITAILSTFASAQLAVPVCCMGYTQIDETILYIQGGLDNNKTAVNQFIALDLTIPTWDTSAPPWSKPLNLNNTNPPASSWHSMVAAKDRGKLFIWDSLQPVALWSTYNIIEKTWSNFSIEKATTANFSVLVDIPQQAGIRNGVNLTSGEVYISSGTGNGTQMIIHTVDPTSGLPVSSLPTTFRQDPIVHESFVWSVYRNSFLHYGGRSMDGTTSNPHLNELLPMSGWVTVNTTGTSPGDVSGHCMVPGKSYGGQRFIVFGGTGLDGIAKDDIHIFHVANNTWTTGASAGLSQARTNMACAVSGDSFIAWGGESPNVNKDVVPIIYDIRNNQWTTQFKRYTGADASGSLSPSRSTAVSGSVESTINIATIGGGIAGAVVVVVIIGFLFYRRRITSRQGSHNNKNETAIGLSVRGPQNPDGDPMGELLKPLYPSSASSVDSQRMYYDREDFFRRLAASPLAGPHSFMRDPQEEEQQQHRSPSGDEGEFARSNNRSHHQQPPSLISARSPHIMSRTTTTTITDWSSNGNDEDCSDERDGDKGAQQQPPSPLSPRNPQTDAIDEQGGQLRAPQWQESLPPVVFLDQNQYLERRQELALMMNAIRAEEEVLERRKLVQDALMAQMRAAYSNPHRTPLDADK